MKINKPIQLCGLTCMIGGASFSATSLWELLHPALNFSGIGSVIIDPTQFRIEMLIFGLVVMPGVFAGQLGYYLIHRGTFSKVILALAVTGLAAFVSGTLYSAVTLKPSALSIVGQLLNMATTPILWGMTALVRKVLPMWQRGWPILAGLIPILLFGLAVPRGLPSFAVTVVVGLLWLVLGYGLFCVDDKGVISSPAGP